MIFLKNRFGIKSFLTLACLHLAWDLTYVDQQH